MAKISNFSTAVCFDAHEICDKIFEIAANIASFPSLLHMYKREIKIKSRKILNDKQTCSKSEIFKMFFFRFLVIPQHRTEEVLS